MIRQLPSGQWQVDYRVNGRRRREGGFRTKREAEKIFSLRKTELLEGRYHLKCEVKPLLFETLGEEYLNLHSIPRKKSCAKDVFYFQRLKKKFGRRFVNEISALDVEQFKMELLRNYSPAYVNRHLAFMGAMYNWAIRMSQMGDPALRNRWGCVVQNPVKWVSREREKSRTRILWSDEEERLREVCLGSNDSRRHALWDLIQFSLNTGMRKGEQLSLHWEQVDLENRIIALTDTKNGEGRNVPINDTVMEILLRWKKQTGRNGYVFASCRNEKYVSIHKGFGTALRKAEIKDFHWHDLRGTFCTRLDMLGVGDKVKQEIMGHKTSWMTNRYTHPTPEYKLEAVQALCQKKSGHFLDTLTEMPKSAVSVTNIR